jgi:hypothetical protein
MEVRTNLLEEEWHKILEKKPFLISEMIDANVPYNDNIVEMFYKHLDQKLDAHKIQLKQKHQTSLAKLQETTSRD